MTKIKNHSELNNLGLKIFHGVEIKIEKLQVLSSIFGSGKIQPDKIAAEMLGFTKDKAHNHIINLEADIIAVRKLQVTIRADNT